MFPELHALARNIGNRLAGRGDTVKGGRFIADEPSEPMADEMQHFAFGVAVGALACFLLKG